MKKELTDRQEDILIFIKEFLSQNGYPPTLRQIGKHFSISSTFGVKRHLDALEKKGYLNVESNASRGISIIRNDDDFSIPTLVRDEEIELNRIPIIGRVAAGSPILAEENIDGSVLIDPSFMNKVKNCFALKVKGDSMVNAGIFEGDLVIVSPKHSALTDEIIVARIDDEVTVKRYFTRENEVKLIPENDKYSPIIITNKNDFSIIGKVTGVVRWIN
ncbi:MAG TPA: transcriptional repressor LexA [Ignavibacteriaceae bacterium]|nr:transcriptional repressor LexA [Ignavibacteriaceae bacterium]